MNKSLSVSMELTTESPSHDTSTMPMPPQARVLLQMLRRIQHGALRLTCPDGSVLQFGESDAPVALRLNNWKPCMAAMKSGDIGFAESFIAGDWHTDDLTALLQLLVRNRNALEQAIYGSWW
ncbi:MAG: SAM-dependent methyltransferase, partial [Oxalobacteraceae bacterium]|nr:SAM-dependent methyltransferase [Oxalobacteraceae bacterium]